MRRVGLSFFCLLASLATAVSAQEVVTEVALARGPRFLYAASSKETPVRVDVRRTPMLSKRITLDLHDVTLEDALTEITRQAGLRLSYSKAVVPLAKTVRLKAEEITVAGAISEVLFDTDVDVLFTTNGQAILVSKTNASDVVPTGTITGRVSEAKTGMPVPSAQVSVVGTALGRQTDDSGRYTIIGVPAGTRTVNVRRLGYDPISRSVEVRDGETLTLDFALVGAMSRLAEIVTTVTGGQRRIEIGNAIATIGADSTVMRAPVRDLGDLIAGRAAGVQVMFQNGYAGQAPAFRIRGANSITLSNDPIVVIDGIRVENATATNLAAGRLSDVNPEEIERLEVVKGPSAATLYGTDAANGVIVITTKRGRVGPTTWNAYEEQGMSELPVTWPSNYYAWGHNVATGAVQQCVVAAVAAGTCVQDSLTTFNPLASSKSPIGTGHRQQHGLQVSGGSSALRYFLSGELEDERGYLRLPDSERRFLAAQRGGSELPWWEVSPNQIWKTSWRANLNDQLGSTADAAISAGLVRNYTAVPLIPADGLINGALQGRGTADTLTQWGSVGQRPAFGFLDRRLDNVDRLTSGMTTNWRPAGWLTTRGSLGLDFTNDEISSLIRQGESPTVPLGSRSVTVRGYWNYTLDLGASAYHALSPTATSRTSTGMQYNRRRVAVNSVFGSGLLPGAEVLTGAAAQTFSESNTESAVAGGYVEEALGLRERLFLTAAIRLDGASSFGREFSAAAYPKASVSWLAIQDAGSEARFRINTLRLRSAYGASGVQPGPTAGLPIVALLTGLVNGVSTSGALLSSVGNTAQRPERQKELEGGFDLDAVDGRIRLEATAYQRESSDALVNQPFAYAFGLGRTATQTVNIGRVRNAGVEGLLDLHAVDRPSVSWEITLNGNVNRNRLVRLSKGVPRIGTPPFPQVPGYPIFGIWDRPILSYSDANKNGIIEASEVTVGDTAVYVGPMLPPRQLTTSSSLQFLNRTLRVDAVFDYRGGNKRFNSGEANRCRAPIQNCEAMNVRASALDRQVAAVVLNQYGMNTGYIEDGSFTRFRELSVSYSSAKLAQRIRARNAVLSISGRNLATFTKYSGPDPESGSPGTDTRFDGPTAYPARYLITRLTVGF